LRIISEAGVRGIADPGAMNVVRIAHEKNNKSSALVGHHQNFTSAYG